MASCSSARCGARVKALDLLRDPRFALHSGSEEPDDWPGEAKIAGTVRAETRTSSDDDGQYHLFIADITEAVLVFLNEERTKLVVESWHEGRGIERLER